MHQLIGCQDSKNHGKGYVSKYLEWNWVGCTYQNRFLKTASLEKNKIINECNLKLILRCSLEPG